MSIKRTITIGDRKKKAVQEEEKPLFKRRPNPKGKHLVVVESPAKAKTIERILGSDYKVMASMGHLRDLPQRTLGVDVNHGFTPQYVDSAGRETLIKDLQKEANRSRDILLATDPDREGEAISWHLSKLLDVNPEDNVRIAFHEITPPAIKEAVHHPVPIDLNRVDAQQARRVLDRLVGYKLSPWLWKQVYRGLSAGRVQSVAVRLICEREEEIKAFNPQEYWTVEGIYETADHEKFTARLTAENGKEISLPDKESADRAVKELEKQDAQITSVTKQKKQRKPKPPFTTSTLQQDSVNRLGFGSKKTMMVAQMLYEGVEIAGMGHVGLITYMRTDSVRISDEIQKEALPYIAQTYGAQYVPEKPNTYVQSKDAQDAHEGIRPTSMKFPPEAVAQSLTRDQLRLYTLIWNRFVASQMVPQLSQNTSALLQCGNFTLKANGTHVLFDGFTVVASSKDKEKEKEKWLPDLAKGQTVSNRSIEGEQHFTSPPPRFTEASLIKIMEEKGIGRPSTYAPILDTIQKRKYVEKESKQFIPTELGFTIVNLLKKYFDRVINVDFTAGLETWLDKIAEGKASYAEVLGGFYQILSGELKSADERAAEDMKENQEVSDVLCEKCGAHMIVKMGRYGKYLACPNYPRCRNIKPYQKDGQKEEPSEVACDKCGAMMMYRTGPYGRYLACPKCSATKSIVVDTGIVCPSCKKGHLIRRRSKKGRYFYGCSNYPECTMALWNEPVDKYCPVCGHIMVKKTYKNGTEKILCSNAECPTLEKTKRKKSAAAGTEEKSGKEEGR
mgnify:CR=1 FL=1